MKAAKIVDTKQTAVHKNRSAQLFSGGVDAYTTFLRHMDETPDFVTVWGGGDVNINDTKGWQNVKSHVQKVAGEYSLSNYFVKSNFLEFLNIPNLNTLVVKSGDKWWHGFQHSLALLGLSAPVTYVYDYLYIASTYPEYMKGQYTLASDPTIDNNVRFSGVQVIHDGYELDRQDKVRYLVKRKKEGNPISLRVCWESNGGSNCCKCEKCYRTILEIISEGGEPNEMGFKWNEKSIIRCKNDMLHKIRTSHDNVLFLKEIVEPLKKLKAEKRIGSEYDWFTDIDFNNFNDLPGKSFYNAKVMRKMRNIPKKIKIIIRNHRK